MDDSTKSTLVAVGVGVGATAAIATAMYFLGGREAPKMPTLTGLGDLAKREIGVGALRVLMGPDIPNQIRDHYDAKIDQIPSGGRHTPHHYEYVEDSDTGDITVTCRSGNTVTKDHWDCHRDSAGNCFYSLGGPYGA